MNHENLNSTELPELTRDNVPYTLNIRFWEEGKIALSAKARIDSQIISNENGRIAFTDDGYAMFREWKL